jgi:hypothetical protein
MQMLIVSITLVFSATNFVERGIEYVPVLN